MAAPESELAVALRTACATITEIGAGYALVGGLAVSSHVEPRFTRDVDLVVAVVDDAEAEALVRALIDRGYHLLASVEQTGTGRLATVRFAPPDTDLVVDLLFASCGIEPEIVEAAEAIEVMPRLVIPVARAGHLVAMKLLARDDRERPQDYVDLRALVPILGTSERSRVKASLALIERRGYARGRDLVAAWRALVPPRPRATRPPTRSSGARRPSRRRSPVPR